PTPALHLRQGHEEGPDERRRAQGLRRRMVRRLAGWSEDREVDRRGPSAHERQRLLAGGSSSAVGGALHGRRRPPRYACAAARSRPSISIFFMFSIACMTRCDFSRSGSERSSGSTVGTICHDTPNLSFSHPQGPSSPPSESLLQNLSTSS